MFKGAFKRFTSLFIALMMMLSFFPSTSVSAAVAIASEPLATTDIATFDVNGTIYTGLSAALSAANSNNVSKITLATSGAIPAGDYTIPSGKTLLIPYDEAKTVKTSEGDYSNTRVTPTEYSKLTLSSGVRITVIGSINVGAQLHAASGGSSTCGAVNGPYGRIDMESGSSISVENGGKAYVYGFITGEGNVHAKSGSEIHEAFQMMEFRGGTALSNWESDKKVMPFCQYYVQSIESEITFDYGSKNVLHSAIYASNSITKIDSISFIATSGGLFNLSNGTSITRKYDPATDRTTYDIDGDVTLNSITLKIVISVSSSAYILPINGNLTINVNRGTISISNDIELLPGTQLNIKEGATVNVASGKKLFVYDSTEWLKATNQNKTGFVFDNKDLIGVTYTPTKRKTRTATDLTDVIVDVNGTLSISGYLYTTASGAAIKSSNKTGKVVLSNAPTSATLYQVYKQTNNGSGCSASTDFSYENISITPAQLQNGDGSYTATAGSAASTTFSYCAAHDVWEKNSVTHVKVSFESNGGTTVSEQIIDKGSQATRPADPTKTGFEFDGWFADSELTNEYGFNSALNENITLYAKWRKTSVTSYTITWKNWNGDVLRTDTVEEGTVPEYSGTTPVKDADAQYTYTFVGWTPEIVEATGDATYTATYTPTLRTYTITWKNDDGSVIDTTTVAYGTVPTHADATKAADAQYTYTFAGWDPAPVAVTGEASYTATYTTTVNKYTVTWKNADGTTLETDENVPYGETPVYNGATPTKAATAQYSYSFAGWTPAIADVTGNVTYTATFTETVNEYTITWKNDDGSVIDTTTVAYGTVPTHSDATKAADAQYTYTFAGWDPAPVAVTGGATYTATYTTTVNEYTITWKNDDGSVIDTTTVAYGTVPTHSDATKAADAQYTYTFAGWDPAPVAVTGEATYTATYTTTVNKYTVTWKNADGTVLETDTNVPYGTTPSYDGATPTKAATAQYSYSFAGWTPTLSAVTGDAVYTATFTETVNKYTVTWKNADGTVLETDTNVPYGTTPTYDGATPEKEKTNQYEYTFIGWDPEVTAVTGDAVYTAVFSQQTRKYWVYFLNGDTVLQYAEYDYGETPEYTGETPVSADETDQYGYRFTGWSPAIGPVTGYTEYTAVFEQYTKKYEITFVNEDGTVLQTGEVEYGVMPVYEGENPTKEATAQYTYTFAGWSPALHKVTGAETYTATYSTATNKYNITFFKEDGSDAYATYSVEYGTVPAYQGQRPTKPADAQYTYTFAGWSDEIGGEVLATLPAVTGSAQYYAIFTGTVRTYAITWIIDGASETQRYEYGAMPSHDDPVKESTAEFDYEFTGWSPEITPVTGNATYTAQFKETKRSYTITWKNDDGSVIDTTTVEYGKRPTHDDPEKENTAQFTYTFTGWTPAVTPVTGDATYTATYSTTVNKYTVTWKNFDGTVLMTDTNVEYGTIPSYSGATPERDSTAQFEYEFTGWTPEVTAVTGNAVYTAVFSQQIRKYWIYFVNEDGTVLQYGEYEYGTTPVYNGETPAKEGDAQYGYTFAGWSPAIGTVTGYQEYIATFEQYTKSYEIEFVDEDGAVLQSSEVEYGVMPVYEGETPSKAADAQYTYTFEGWTPALHKVTGAETYVATYSTTVNKYAIRFVNDDGEVLQSGMVAYGETPAYNGPTPTKAATAQYTYTFDKWTPDIVAVTGAATYTATYTATVNKYTIKFVNDDGNELQSEEVAYGETPVYTGETPTKAATAQYTYTFDKWTPDIVAVTGAATYTATYTATVNKYTIKFVNDDGNELQSEEVAYGETPVYSGPTPTKPSTAEHSYVFAGWDPEITAVTGAATYTAKYTESANTYTVIWKNYDGTALETDESVAYGTIPTYDGETPTRTGDAQYSYTFSGWDPEITAVTGDTTYTATFTQAVNKYMVKFLDEDGTELQSEEVAYGETPVYNGETPTKAATAQYTYTFDKWTPDIVAVTGEATYTATYTATVNKYTIKFVNDDGNELQSEEVAYGETPVYNGETPTKATTAQYTYTFDKWTPDIVAVTGEATYTATYTATVNKYVIRFVNDDGNELQSEEVAYGDTPVYNGETPTKTATAQYTYEFDKGTPDIVPVTGEATYTATYTATVNKYTIKFVNDDGNELQSEEVAYGETPVYTGETPTKAATAQYTYTFDKWTPDIVAVTGEATYTATYTATVNKYTVKFLDEDGTELQSDEVAYGETPVYTGETPTKEADTQYKYTFAGWDPEITAVTGDATYTAVYDAVKIEWEGPVWTWNVITEDGFTAEAEANARFTDGDGNTVDKKVTVTGELVKISGKDTTYAYTYTASVEFNGETHSDTYSREFEAVTLIGQTPTLAGVLSINFRFQVPENAATVKFVYAFDGREVELRLSEDGPYYVTESGSGRYKIAFTNIQSACITKDVTMKVYDADGNEMTMIRVDKGFYGTEFSYCMADWAAAMLNDPNKPDDTHALASAILTYGYYASEYFGEKNGNVEKYSFNTEKYGQYLDLDAVAAVEADSENDAEGSAEAKANTSYIGALVVLEGSTSVRLYFDKSQAKPTVKNASGKAYTVYENDIGYFVEVSGIGSGNLNVKYTFVITGADGNDYTVKYSALSWANAMLARGVGSNNEHAAVVNLAKAMYRYWAAADVYFRNHS